MWRMPVLGNRQKAGLAVTLALLLWIPQGISQADHTMVTGHSTFHNGATYDPCLASIAGIMRNRVMWFNDQILVENYGGKGTFVYVTERGAEDPRGRQLYSEGVFYDFVDPNGAHWHVEESFTLKQELVAGVDQSPDIWDADAGDVRDTVTADTQENRTYVWSVELSAVPIYDEFAGADPHTLYNFLVLIDTCKMRNEHTQPGKTGENDTRYNVTHDPASGTLDAEHGHPNGETTHYHEAKLADLYIGTRPSIAPWKPGPNSTDGLMFESQWATSESQPTTTGGQRAAGNATSSGGALP